MKSTANLGLNLYEAADYVLHDSFNSDNQKIDAAVMAAHSFHKLKELTVSTAGSSVSFDLSGIELAVMLWQRQHLMSAGFDRTGLMYRNVSRSRCNNALI